MPPLLTKISDAIWRHYGKIDLYINDKCLNKRPILKYFTVGIIEETNLVIQRAFGGGRWTAEF